MRILGRPGPRFTIEVLHSSGIAVLGLSVLIWLLFATQALLQAPVLPGPGPLIQLLGALLPGVVALALPLGLLFGSTATAWRWADEGQLLALHGSGLGGRRLLPAMLLCGLLLGGVQALLTHWLEPMGRRTAAKALVLAAQELRLQPDQAAILDSVLVHAEEVDGALAEDLFLARGSQIAVAEQGNLGTPGILYLERGEIISLREGSDARPEIEWSLKFDEARVPLELPVLRLDPPTLSASELQDRISRMETQGQAPLVEKTTWYKRSTLPMALPLLGLLGLALGARRVRPAISATSVGLGWWTLMRICDHLVPVIGAEVSVLTPLAGLMLLTGWSWVRWAER